jgi:hypothetical protein
MHFSCPPYVLHALPVSSSCELIVLIMWDLRFNVLPHLYPLPSKIVVSFIGKEFNPFEKLQCYNQLYFFLNKTFWDTNNDPKFGRRGVVLVIPMPGKKVPEHCSSVCPSEKELLEWRSGTFHHISTPGFNKELRHIEKIQNTQMFIALSRRMIQRLALLFSFIHFNCIALHPCLNISPFQTELLVSEVPVLLSSPYSS